MKNNSDNVNSWVISNIINENNLSIEMKQKQKLLLDGDFES